MKKLSLILGAFVALILVSCDEKESNESIGDGKIITDKQQEQIGSVDTSSNKDKIETEAEKLFKNETDSLSYSLGILCTSETMGIFKNVNYTLFVLGVNDVFNKEINQEILKDRIPLLEQNKKNKQTNTDTLKGSGTTEIKNDKDKLSYVIGHDYGQGFVNKFKVLNLELFEKGVKDAESNNKLITNKTAFEIFNIVTGRLIVKEQREWLEKNKQKPGVQQTASGLQYRVIRKGDGPQPKATDKVKVHYRGTLISGKQFDSSYDRGQPASFGLNQVIKGWTEGLQLMKVGAKYEFYIPYNLGYGAQGTRGIPPYSTLKFEVELLAVE